MNGEIDIWFYDNLFMHYEKNLFEIERIYCLKFDLFSESDWLILSETYKKLPNWKGYKTIPYWFGDDDDIPPFLWASVEPSGLQVYGIIDKENWNIWDSKFKNDIENLPKRILN